jgi:photosystem II stability/assembly factor-like uncharacterized protein
VKIPNYKYRFSYCCLLFFAVLAGCSDTEKIIIDNDEVTYEYRVTPQSSGTTNDLRDVFFVDAKEGWVVGSGGIILHTSDGGGTWSPQNSATSGTLSGVFFIDADTGWAVGNAGTILRTTDGGDTWTVQQSHTAADLTDVFFFNGFLGWAVGDGVFLMTIDRGDNWQLQTKSDTVIYAVSFTSSRNGWATALFYDQGISLDVIILHTTDGGQSWLPRQSTSSYPLFDVTFIDSLHGWMAGVGGVIVYTSDGGEKWGNQDAQADYNLRGIAFWDSQTGVAVGENGTIRVTVDGGTTWSQVESGVQTYLAKVSFGDFQNMWVVGDSGTILKVTRTEVQSGS